MGLAFYRLQPARVAAQHNQKSIATCQCTNRTPPNIRAFRQPFTRGARVPVRVRIDAPDSPGTVPAIPDVAAGVDATAADAVSAAVCEKLAEDAAQTTLMVVAFQRWYREQREANGDP